MKSSNDTVESLAAYIRAYAIEYFDSTPISCSVQVTILPNVEMSGEKRRNIFLSIKEALNNILKHANATHVLIDILAQTDKLKIIITDNGVGIDVDKLRRFGNGLSNMKKRMQSINGDFHIHADGGTVLRFEIPI
jgi:signal transduction histidine kinase